MIDDDLETLRAMRDKLDDVITKWPAARATMLDAQAGYPKRASGSSPGDHPMYDREAETSIVERLTVEKLDPDLMTDDVTAAIQQLDRARAQIRTSVLNAWGIVATWSRTPEKPRHLKDGDGNDIVPFGWCSSCYRDDHYHRPILRRRTGEPYYAGLCGFCGREHAATGKWPPLEDLVNYHLGRRRPTKVTSPPPRAAR